MMFNFIFTVTIVLSVVSAVSALAIPRRSDAPSGYAEGYLEPYDTYHARYVELGCDDQHGTSFFDQCCHPLLATETLAQNRPPQCNPANASATSSASETTESSTSSSNAPTPTGSAGPANVPVNAGGAPLPPTTTSTPPTTTSTPPATTHSSTSSSNAASPTSADSNNEYTGGFATFFYQNGVAGACGAVHQDTDYVAALDTALYGDLSQVSPNCGRKLQITNTNNGKQVTVTVADACPTCTNANSVDLSVGAFTQIATEEEGEVPIVWDFIS